MIVKMAKVDNPCPMLLPQLKNCSLLMLSLCDASTIIFCRFSVGPETRVWHFVFVWEYWLLAQQQQSNTTVSSSFNVYTNNSISHISTFTHFLLNICLLWCKCAIHKHDDLDEWFFHGKQQEPSGIHTHKTQYSCMTPICLPNMHWYKIWANKTCHSKQHYWKKVQSITNNTEMRLSNLLSNSVCYYFLFKQLAEHHGIVNLQKLEKTD